LDVAYRLARNAKQVSNLSLRHPTFELQNLSDLFFAQQRGSILLSSRIGAMTQLVFAVVLLATVLEVAQLGV
jgi:hypothetical protein